MNHLLKSIRSIFFIIMLTFTITKLWCQPTSKIDSMHNELIVKIDILKDDSANVTKIYKYAILCSEKNGAWNSEKEPDVCYYGYNMSKRIGYKKGITDFIFVLQKCFRQKEGLPLINFHTYPDRISRNKIRLLHQARKQLHGGTVDWYRHAMSDYVVLKMYREAGILRFWNGLAYYDSESFREAHRLFDDAKQYFFLANDWEYLLKLYLYKGCAYFYQKNYPAALIEFNHAKALSIQLSDSSALANTLYNRGEIYLALQQPQQAITDFSDALKIEISHTDTCKSVMGYIKIARACFAAQQFSDCKNLLQKALLKAKETDDKPGESEILYLMAQSLIASGNKIDAALYLNKFTNLHDSLFTEELSDFIKDREYFWINKLGRQITHQAFVDHERNSFFIELRKNKLLLWGVLAISIILGLIGILLYRANANNKKANHYLKELDKTRNLFFSIIAHDLRGPMMATELFLKPAIINAERYGEKELLLSLKEINLQNNSQKLLLDNLLFWAGLQRGTLTCQLQKVSIRDIFKNSMHLYLTAAKQKGSNILIEKIESEFIWADENMMFLITRNLIDNALKHAGGAIEIILTGIIENKYLRIQISDNGSGINPLVLDKFMKDNSAEQTENGHKLGLSLVKDFVRMQGGTIKIERLSSGTCISFTIPLYQEK